jgi:uncharacterized protein YbjT (DUF2867 family)
VPRILVIGATGKIGREVIDQLSATQADVRALVRNAASVTAPGVEAVPGDLTIPETLDRALDGIDTVFLVWTAPPLTVAPVLDRIATRTRRIVFLSAPWKTPHPFFQKPQPNPGVNLLAEIERRIESSGLEWTFLRPAMFASNAFHWWGPQIRGGDIVRWPYLSAATAPVDARDIAAVAIRALCYDGHAGAEYVLTGPQSLTQREQISIIGSVIGRSLRVEDMSPDETRAEWRATWPVPVMEMLLAAWSGAAGEAAFLTSTVADVTGTPARTFQQWAMDHAWQFRS